MQKPIEEKFPTFSSSEKHDLLRESSSIKSMESIDIMESQPNEDPRQPIIPSQHPRPSLMMTTLESFLGNAFRKKLNLIQEDEPIFQEQIEVSGGK